MKLKFTEIKKTFEDFKTITTSDLFYFYKLAEPAVKKATVNWRIYKLIQSGRLQRIGRGKYIVGKEIKYIPDISTKVINICNLLKKEFPFISHCIWNTSILNEFNSIVVNSFVSEAPVQNIKNIPTSSLEKLLVDLFCDKNLFYFLQGNELVNIYKNAFDKYTVNQSKLLRYADRRRKKKQIKEFIKTIIRQ